jgi:hypothetical protein
VFPRRNKKARKIRAEIDVVFHSLFHRVSFCIVFGVDIVLFSGRNPFANLLQVVAYHLPSLVTMQLQKMDAYGLCRSADREARVVGFHRDSN